MILSIVSPGIYFGAYHAVFSQNFSQESHKRVAEVILGMRFIDINYKKKNPGTVLGEIFKEISNWTPFAISVGQISSEICGRGIS